MKDRRSKNEKVENTGRVNTVATHRGYRHVDELVAIRLLKKFGERKFPGVRDAKLQFYDAGHNKNYRNLSAEEWQEEGVLLVDIGGGRFDHPKDGSGCAASQVAKVLELYYPQELEFVAYATKNDLKGGANFLDLAQILKDLSRNLSVDPRLVMRWGFEALDALSEFPLPSVKDQLRERLRLNRVLTDTTVAYWLYEQFNPAKTREINLDINALARTTSFSDVSSQTINIAKSLGVYEAPGLKHILGYAVNNYVKANRTEFDFSELVGAVYLKNSKNMFKVCQWASYVLNSVYHWQKMYEDAGEEYDEKSKEFLLNHRTGRVKLAIIESENPMMAKKAREKGAVVVLHISKEFTYISANKRIITPHEMADFVSALRLEEQKFVKTKNPITDWKILRSEGTLPEIPQWHFQSKACSIFNNSLSSWDAPKTTLPPEQIHSTMTISLDNQHMPGCDGGKTQCVKENCSVYQYGFNRCRTKRYNEYSKQTQNRQRKKGRPSPEIDASTLQIAGDLEKALGATVKIK